MSTPERSDGARMERKAMRAYLRRKLSVYLEYERAVFALNETLGWVLSRQKRFDKRVGGLGRK